MKAPFSINYYCDPLKEPYLWFLTKIADWLMNFLYTYDREKWLECLQEWDKIFGTKNTIVRLAIEADSYKLNAQRDEKANKND